FNSLAAIEAGAGITNPMVNSGAIATTSLTPGTGVEDRWAFLREGLERFTGRDLTLDDEVYTCAMETNTRNRSIAALLETYGTISGDPAEALDLYTRQCSLLVTAHDLAVMGATLADGGVNPVTGLRVVSAETCHHVLALMLTAGMYEHSGRWLAAVGLPAKSGIGGGIVTVSPGKGGLGTFAPRLDRAGNSVQGQEVARYLSARLGLDLLASSPAAREA
ncbi:MAG: glutaminase, partial [Baekduiaceae bacterium]